MERAMKIQEVILRAMAKKITWWQAAEIVGLSDRSMRRWRSATRSTDTTGCWTGGGGSRARNAFPWRRRRKCCGYIGKSMRT